MRPLFYFFGGAMGLFLYFTSCFAKLRAGFAVELFHTVFDLLGRVLGLVLYFATGFARPLVGPFLIGGRATG